MTDSQRFILIAGILNGALFLVAAFVAGLMLHNDKAWQFALSDMGLVYLTCVLQLSAPQMRATATVLVIGTIGLGLAAWLALILGGTH